MAQKADLAQRAPAVARVVKRPRNLLDRNVFAARHVHRRTGVHTRLAQDTPTDTKRAMQCNRESAPDKAVRANAERLAQRVAMRNSKTSATHTMHNVCVGSCEHRLCHLSVVFE